MVNVWFLTQIHILNYFFFENFIIQFVFEIPLKAMLILNRIFVNLSVRIHTKNLNSNDHPFCDDDHINKLIFIQE